MQLTIIAIFTFSHRVKEGHGTFEDTEASYRTKENQDTESTAALDKVAEFMGDVHERTADLEIFRFRGFDGATRGVAPKADTSRIGQCGLTAQPSTPSTVAVVMVLQVKGRSRI